jgi:hypothetical protein
MSAVMADVYDTEGNNDTATATARRLPHIFVAFFVVIYCVLCVFIYIDSQRISDTNQDEVFLWNFAILGCY